MHSRSLFVVALAVLASACPPPVEEADGSSAPTAPETVADPEVVAVDWLGRGAIYAAVVRERRGELTHVEYANGEREWALTSRIQAWPDLTNQQVQIWTPRGPVQGTLVETRGFLVHLRFEDGAHTWFGRDQLYALQGSPPEIVGGAARAAFPLRAGVDPSAIVVGAKVLSYWLNAGELMPERPWTAEIVAVEGERVQVRYLYDDSVGMVTK